MNTAMRRVLGLIAALMGVAVVAAVIVTLRAPATAHSDLWWWLKTHRELARSRPSVPIADPSFGLLVLALVFLWARSVWRGDDAPGAPSWRARRSNPQPAGADVLADLLGQRREDPTFDLPQMDPEAGGEHVERWRPEDAASEAASRSGTPAV
jgi:hypothetical protein